MDKRLIDLVECQIFPAFDALSESLQTSNLDAGKVTVLYDTVLAGAKALWAEEVGQAAPRN